MRGLNPWTEQLLAAEPRRKPSFTRRDADSSGTSLEARSRGDPGG